MKFYQLKTAILAVIFFPQLSDSSTTKLSCDNSKNLTSITNQSGTFDLTIDPNKSNLSSSYTKICGALTECLKLVGKESADNLKGVLGLITADLQKAKSSETNLKTIADVKRVQGFLDQCKGQSKKYSSKTIKIDYPLNGPNRAVKSSGYDSEALKKIIHLALLNGVDPYLLIALRTLESPPVPSAGNQGYTSSYGDLPIDGLPFVDAIGCLEKKPTKIPDDLKPWLEKVKPLYEKRDKISHDYAKVAGSSLYFIMNLFTKYGNDEGNRLRDSIELAAQEFKQSGCPLKTVDKIIAEKYCKDESFRKSYAFGRQLSDADQEIRKFYESNSVNDDLKKQIRLYADSEVAFSIKATSTAKEFTIPYGGPETRFLCRPPDIVDHGDNVSFMTLPTQQKNQCCVKVKGLFHLQDSHREFSNYLAALFVKEKIKVSPDSLNKLTEQIQKFNGTGIVGTTEKSGANCINGIHMGTRPYYGARAADLMINSLMKNSELNAIIQTEAQNFGLGVPSILCNAGTGNEVVVEDSIFLEQQKTFLLNGSDGNYKTKLKSGKVDFPTTPEDIELFKAQEAARAKTCSSYFK